MDCVRLVFPTLRLKLPVKDFGRLGSHSARLSHCCVPSPDARHRPCKMTTCHLRSWLGRSPAMHMTSIAGRDAGHSRHFCNETAGRHAGCEIISRQDNGSISLKPFSFEWNVRWFLCG